SLPWQAREPFVAQAGGGCGDTVGVTPGRLFESSAAPGAWRALSEDEFGPTTNCRESPRENDAISDTPRTTSEAAQRPSQRTRSIRSWNGLSGVTSSRKCAVFLSNPSIGLAAGFVAATASLAGASSALSASSTVQR